MKEKFNKTYDLLYDMYPDGYFVHRFSRFDKDFLGFAKISSELREFYIRQELVIELMKREILDFEIQRKFPFRSDAKYFLITNFNNMIIKPILYQILENDKEISEDILREYITSDIKTIMYNSLEIRKEELISGHDILKSIDSLWPQLQSTKMELWG
jgi:hypothetical protein